jgi:hypothetical protein
MSAASSDDARDVSSGSSVPASPGFAADDPKISAYLAHLAHVGDVMAGGLGALFAEKFPEVPSLAAIHEDYQFSKNDSLLLFAGLDGNALADTGRAPSQARRLVVFFGILTLPPSIPPDLYAT